MKHIKFKYLVAASALLLANASSALVSGAAEATLTIQSDWGAGYCANVVIQNSGTSEVNGWSVELNLNGSAISNLWNGNRSGETVRPVTHNASIAPGNDVSFGFCATGNSRAELSGFSASGQDSSTPQVASSSVANSSSVTPVISSSSAAAVSSSAPAVVSSSSAPQNCDLMCKWYQDAPRPLCTNQDSGWGWENQQSCIGRTTCESQSGAGGVISNCSSTTVSSSSVPQVISSSSSIVLSSSSWRSSSSAPAPSSSSAKSSSSASSYDSNWQGQAGHATRYWDCCKAHCGWEANVPAGVNVLPSCDVNDEVILSATPDMVKSSCDGGDGHMCHSMAPWKVTDALSYGYAAVPGAQADICGRCYELEFTGVSYNGGDDPGSQAMQGKRMIVQATNIGYDVAGGQFDLLVPGGGVGAFNACTDQWGISTDQLGKQYGGMLAACKEQLGWNAAHSEYKSCLAQSCEVFNDRGLGELYEGCMWYVDFFEASDNPSLKYREVSCPAAITERSGVDRGGL